MSDEKDYDEGVDDAEMKSIDAFDFPRVLMLLSVVEKQSTVAPKATSLSGLALAALEEMNNEAKEIARERAERIKAADVEQRAVEQQRIDREREEAEASIRPRAVPAAQLQAEGKPATTSQMSPFNRPAPPSHDEPNRRG